MKRFMLAVVALLSVILQVSVLPAFRPFGVVPNIVLVLVVLIGLEGTASVAVVVAVAGGLALDLTSGANFGLWTGLLVLAALSAGLLHRAGIELAGGTVAVVMVAIGTIVMAVVTWLSLLPIVLRWPMGLLFGRLAAELVLNLILIVILRPLILRVVPVVASDELAAR